MSRTPVRVQPAAAVIETTAVSVAVDLLAWYDRHRRELPWRAPPGQQSDPYAVWISEIMLQQTTVAAVRPYFQAFLQRWPSVATLAAAPLERVLQAWAGLGYYSRARNLHACAQAIVERHGGRFPETEDGLRTLPGIGAYTAAAIAAIVFDRRAVVVDGNVERVMARLFATATPLPAARPALRQAMDAVTPHSRVGDFAQAVMDLGATICTPRNPACILCPLAGPCSALKTGAPAEFPRKAAKASVPLRRGAVFYVKCGGRVLLRNRPAHGLFGGMAEFPGTPWTQDFDPDTMILPEGVAEPLTPVGTVEHGLTHFRLELHVFRASPDQIQPVGQRWVARESLESEALPTLMRKVLALGQSAGRPAGSRGSPAQPTRSSSSRSGRGRSVS